MTASPRPAQESGQEPGLVLLSCEVVLFDCDGVLVDSDASVERAWSRWALHHGLPPAEVVAHAHGRRAADTVAALLPEELHADALDLVNALELEDAPTVTALPGARALLASIPPDRWAVVTSGTSRLAQARLAAAGLPLPAILVTADDVSRGKPDPEGYLASAAAGGVAPARAVVVEDSSSGIRAGRAAGAGAVLGVGERAVRSDADVVVPDLACVRWAPDGLRVDPRATLR